MFETAKREIRESEGAVYPSKRDRWVTVVCWIGVMILIVGGAVNLRIPIPLWTGFILFALYAAGAGFTLSVLYGTYYVINHDHILIRSGPFKWVVPLKSIVSVTPSRNMRSSPACSLDRLDIRCQAPPNRILISPVNQDGFLDDLVARCKHLERRGNRLVMM